MIRLVQDFQRIARMKMIETKRVRRDFLKRAEDERKRNEAAEETEISDLVATVSAALASQEIMAAQRVKIDSFDYATVQALIYNQEQLDAVSARMDLLLGRAYVMPDGRRVFRTADGTQVFDEEGNAVTADELDPDLISPEAPTWEEFEPIHAEKERLVAEREALLDYQKRLDAARARIDAGDMTEAEIDDLDADLSASMPPAVSDIVRGVDAAPRETHQTEGKVLTEEQEASRHRLNDAPPSP